MFQKIHLELEIRLLSDVKLLQHQNNYYFSVDEPYWVGHVIYPEQFAILDEVLEGIHCVEQPTNVFMSWNHYQDYAPLIVALCPIYASFDPAPQKASERGDLSLGFSATPKNEFTMLQKRLFTSGLHIAETVQITNVQYRATRKINLNFTPAMATRQLC